MVLIGIFVFCARCCQHATFADELDIEVLQYMEDNRRLNDFVRDTGMPVRVGYECPVFFVPFPRKIIVNSQEITSQTPYVISLTFHDTNLKGTG